MRIVLKEHSYFADWDDRLKEFFPTEYPYFHAVLTTCAHQGRVSIQEAHDLSHLHKIGMQYKGRIDDVLAKDGYLYEDDTFYKFHSPLVQTWWKNRHPLLAKKKK